MLTGHPCALGARSGSGLLAIVRGLGLMFGLGLELSVGCARGRPLQGAQVPVVSLPATHARALRPLVRLPCPLLVVVTPARILRVSRAQGGRARTLGRFEQGPFLGSALGQLLRHASQQTAAPRPSGVLCLAVDGRADLALVAQVHQALQASGPPGVQILVAAAGGGWYAVPLASPPPVGCDAGPVLHRTPLGLRYAPRPVGRDSTCPSLRTPVVTLHGPQDAPWDRVVGFLVNEAARHPGARIALAAQ